MNPITGGRLVKINGAIGQKILQKYMSEVLEVKNLKGGYRYRYHHNIDPYRARKPRTRKPRTRKPRKIQDEKPDNLIIVPTY